MKTQRRCFTWFLVATAVTLAVVPGWEIVAIVVGTVAGVFILYL